MIRLPPSRANLWVPCPGSAQAESFFPDHDTAETDHGRSLHDVAADALQDLILWGSVQPLRDADHLDDSDRAIVEYYLNDVAARVGESDLTGVSLSDLLVEHAVVMPGRPESKGRIDCALVSKARGRIIVWDLKSGFVGRDAKDDWQTRDYVQALIAEASIDGHADQHFIVELRIVQPRAYGFDKVSVWVQNAANMRADFNAIQHAIDDAGLPEPPTRAGLHCVNCRAFTRCRTARKAADQVLTVSESLRVLDLTDADQAAAAYLLKPRLKLAKKLIDALENNVIAVLEAGGSIHGWAIRKGKGRAVWANDKGDAPILDALSLYGVNGAKPPELAAISTVEPAAQRAGLDLRAAGLVKTSAGSSYIVPVETHGLGAEVFKK